MTFPLEALSAAVTARVETWARLEMRWHACPIRPNHGKPVVSVDFESSAWLAEVMIWATGDAELATVRLADDRIVNKHYELAGHGDIEVLLDEFVGLLVDDRIPGGAVVATQRRPAALQTISTPTPTLQDLYSVGTVRDSHGPLFRQ